MRQGDTTGALLSAAAILLCGYIPVISSKLQTSGYYNKIKEYLGREEFWLPLSREFMWD